jgi:hypothetical protein
LSIPSNKFQLKNGCIKYAKEGQKSRGKIIFIIALPVFVYWPEKRREATAYGEKKLYAGNLQ